MAKANIDDALQPTTVRTLPGLIPESAAELLSAYVIVSMTALKAVGVPPSGAISKAFKQVMEKEWNIEGAQGIVPMYRHGWEDTFPASVYQKLYEILVPMDLKGRLEWQENLLGNFQAIAQSNLPVSGSNVSHRFGESNAIFFFYRALANMLYIVMKVLAENGMPIQQAITLVMVPGLSMKQSRQLNQAIIDLAAHDWLKSGFEALYTIEERNQVARWKEEYKVRVEQQWAEYRAEQARLRQKWEELESYERALHNLKAPLDIMQDVASFLGSIPPIAWYAAAAAGGYFFVVRPIIQAVR